METESLVNEVTQQEALGWLRNVLAGALEVAPISPWIKKPTRRMIRKIPDWLMRVWAKALNVNYLNGYHDSPNLPLIIKTEAYRDAIQRHLEDRTAMPTLNILQDLIPRVLRLDSKGKLPLDKRLVERDIIALSLSELAPEGRSLGEEVGAILSSDEQPNQVLIDYQIALERRDIDRLEKVDGLLGKSGYGRWVAERIFELKRWFGFELMTTRINSGERTPQWDALWKSVILGGQK